ncbi:Hypothetical protein FKW44_014961 [Caligus rogercresseyi]|uniref:Uncharacterized protein n=1 Tax=Caligus rogercresseyi TaxID=217165 RepID=A0A7T8K096_CALRO|nr:Hypothetical protein FKW44_014961 [Caligus rogercresseyi]
MSPTPTPGPHSCSLVDSHNIFSFPGFLTDLSEGLTHWESDPAKEQLETLSFFYQRCQKLA